MGAEMLLQYLWEHRLWPEGSLRTSDGLDVQVIDPGRRNNDAGPDFFNAKVSIGGRVWAGNVEIHVNSSDWRRHGHHTDPAYDSVVLHAVGRIDCVVERRDGSPIPQVELPYTTDYRRRYDAMVNSPSNPACRDELPLLPPMYVTDWVASLGYERLYAKVERINAALERLDGDWQAAAYVTVARALGFSTNSDPFERLAYSTPLRCLLKHRDEPQLLEATLLGQAGFLDTVTGDDTTDRYIEALRADYSFMRAKYDLQPPGSLSWKMARMRPPNFPHRRIAALVSLIAGGFAIGRDFAHVDDEASARALFKIDIAGYWVSHYTFGHHTACAPQAFSASSVTSLLINALIPLLYAYGCYFGNDRRMQAAVELLQRLPAENNSVTRIFTDCGVACDDAFTSQALIQLRRAYCEPRKCLYCRIGHRLLAAKTLQ